MGEKLYLECSGGISGDMTAAMLLDLGADETVLRRALDSLPLSGYRTSVRRVKKSGIDCCDFLVELEEEYENHDHDMAYLHGEPAHNHAHGPEEPGHNHAHGPEDHVHNHAHGPEEPGHNHAHGPEEHAHGHAHRGLTEIWGVIEQADITENARALAKRIFSILAGAEARAHGVPSAEVHFHEVGAVDSIVDIVAVAVCLDNLNVEEVIVPRVCEGQGTVRCQHGILPVPVPAVANILEEYQIPVELLPVQGEFVTPTGAAIVAAVRTGEALPSVFRIKKVGLGAGKRTYERPSILRGMLLEVGDGEEQPGLRSGGESIYKLESNLDDCTGENLGYVMELLMEAGARDVHYTPVYMKKNRPGWQLNVICTGEQIGRLEEIIFRETTTIGIRRQKMERSVLERSEQSVSTPWGEARVKVCAPGGVRRCYPEYESVRKICRDTGRPYWEVYQKIWEESTR